MRSCVHNTTAVKLYHYPDFAAFYSGKKYGAEGEWYHILHGGGFVRMIESFRPPVNSKPQAQQEVKG